LVARVASLKARLPRFMQRRLPADVPSALLFLAYAGTVVFALISIVQASGDPNRGAITFLAAFYLAAGCAGLWFGTNLIVLIPSVVLWLLIVQLSIFFPPPSYSGVLIFGSFSAVGVWAGVRSFVRKRLMVVRATQSAGAASNQLGWDLYTLSSHVPQTDERVEQIGVYRDLRVGELQRHFDQVTSAAIRGGMEHAFRLKGWTEELHGVPGGWFDTSSHTSLGGSGTSSVQLGMAGTIVDELTGEAFVAVFEQPGEPVDTIRAVVPSERQVRAYVAQLLAFWSGQVGVNSAAEVMIRRYAAAITGAVSSDSSYVGDRLNAMLRQPAADRPAVTVIGEQLDHHAVLVGAIRFGSAGPLYQLFPIALVRALVALIEGRRLPPQPPAGLPPADRIVVAGSELETLEPATTAAAPSNGHVPDLEIRTMGGLRITAGAEDLTSALLDRKVLAFLWLHLLARTLRKAGDTITRSSLADELSPGLDSSAQRSRLRGRLSELRNQLPASLGQRVKVEGERISLDLADCKIDLRELADAARTHGSSKGVLTPEQLAQVESVVTGAKGSFLPEWDDIELHVNSGRSGAGEVVSELRKRTDDALTALLRTLGAGYLAHGNAEAAIAPLERALAISPGDEATARSLSTACVQTGRLLRAEELRKDFSLV
jgi:DNA-binding SARP family transcriptional activator